MLVDQKWKCDARFFPKQPRVVPVAQPDSREIRTLFFESLLVFAQLRNVLAAANSTIVAQEDKNSGAAFPKRTERRLVHPHLAV